MDSTATCSADFGPAQIMALKKAGTVALPFPYPATGPLFLVAGPQSFVKQGRVHDVFFKSVQRVNSKHVITRYVRLEDVRAITRVVKSESKGKDARQQQTAIDPIRETLSIESLGREIHEALGKLEAEHALLSKSKQVGKLAAKLEKDAKHILQRLFDDAAQRLACNIEILLWDAAVLHVPEMAPVLVQVHFEAGVTAAESLQWMGPMRPDGCCD